MSSTTGRGPSLDYLTGMRGYAALAVFAIHWVGILIPSGPEWLRGYVNLGAQGVIVFFTLSAFSLSMSVETSGRTWKEYTFRRFMRIAPAYYFCLVIALIVGRVSYWSVHFQTPFDLPSFLWHLTFTNWLDFRHTNNAIGVEWTLSIEVLFYCLLPVLLAASRRGVGCILLVAAAIGLQHLQNPDLPSEAWMWSPAPFAIAFVAGVLTWRLWQAVSVPSQLGWPTLILVFLVLVALNPKWGFENGVTAWAIGTGLLILTGRSPAGSFVFGNWLAVQLGDRSYSLYLVHLAVISVVAQLFGPGPFPATVALVGSILGTEFLYRFIELPAIRWTARRSSTKPATV